MLSAPSDPDNNTVPIYVKVFENITFLSKDPSN